MSKYVYDYRELNVYKASRQLAKDIFSITKSFPREETYSLTDQIRRSSRSIGAQIAEAWARRRYENHFVSKLTDADAEQQETQHWIEIASDCGYLSEKQTKSLLEQCRSLGRMLGSMIVKSQQFCTPSLNNKSMREPETEYLFDSNDKYSGDSFTDPPITDLPTH